MNYYKEIFSILGIKPTKDIPAIQRAYDRKAKQYKNSDDQTEWINIRNAYQSALAYAGVAEGESFAEEKIDQTADVARAGKSEQSQWETRSQTGTQNQWKTQNPTGMQGRQRTHGQSGTQNQKGTQNQPNMQGRQPAQSQPNMQGRPGTQGQKKSRAKVLSRLIIVLVGLSMISRGAFTVLRTGWSNITGIISDVSSGIKLSKSEARKEIAAYLREKYGDKYTLSDKAAESMNVYEVSGTVSGKKQVIGYQSNVSMNEKRVSCYMYISEGEREEDKTKYFFMDNMQYDEIRNAMQHEILERTGLEDGMVYFAAASEPQEDFVNEYGMYASILFTDNLSEYFAAETEVRKELIHIFMDTSSGEKAVDHGIDENTYGELYPNGQCNFYFKDTDIENVGARLALIDSDNDSEKVLETEQAAWTKALDEISAEYNIHVMAAGLPVSIFTEIQVLGKNMDDVANYLGYRASVDAPGDHPPISPIYFTTWYQSNTKMFDGSLILPAGKEVEKGIYLIGSGGRLMHDVSDTSLTMTEEPEAALEYFAEKDVESMMNFQLKVDIELENTLYSVSLGRDLELDNIMRILPHQCILVIDKEYYEIGDNSVVTQTTIYDDLDSNTYEYGRARDLISGFRAASYNVIDIEGYLCIPVEIYSHRTVVYSVGD